MKLKTRNACREGASMQKVLTNLEHGKSTASTVLASLRRLIHELQGVASAEADAEHGCRTSLSGPLCSSCRPLAFSRTAYLHNLSSSFASNAVSGRASSHPQPFPASAPFADISITLQPPLHSSYTLRFGANGLLTAGLLPTPRVREIEHSLLTTKCMQSRRSDRVEIKVERGHCIVCVCGHDYMPLPVAS